MADQRTIPIVDCDHQDATACLSRRDLFRAIGATALGVSVLAIPGWAHGAEEARLEVASYPKKKIVKLAQLKDGKAVDFFYPIQHPHCASFLVKLGARAGGGIGDAQDIVAFNALCTHMGALLTGMVNAKYKVAGPCPLHLTTFDLTRHGIVVAGHATESLPQIQLAIEDEWIVATGVMGLIYGYADNPR